MSWNDLYKKTGAELREAFQSIPPTVTTLDLSKNDLYKKTGAELALAFQSIPATVTTLHLNRNSLGKVFQSSLDSESIFDIEEHAHDLSNGYVHLETEHELTQAFAAIPPDTAISLKGDDLFRNKERDEIDDLLRKLRRAAGGRNLDLSGNGESDILRALPALVGLSKQNVQAGEFLRPVPRDAIEKIASFLLPKDTSFAKIHGLFSSPTISQVMQKPSENERRVAGRAPSIEETKPKGFCIIS